MKEFMAMIIVPLGYAGRVVQAANEAGATGATLMRSRGMDDSAGKGLFSFTIEPEEEIILVRAEHSVVEAVCRSVQDELNKRKELSGSIYLLPVQP